MEVRITLTKLVNYSVFLIASLNLLQRWDINNNLFVACLETKYFKRFYFGNLSVDLTEELGERFNYDYLPKQPPLTSSNGYHHHPIQVKQASTPFQYPHHNPDHNVGYISDNSNNIEKPVSSSSSSSSASSSALPSHHLHEFMHADQPQSNATTQPPGSTAPPPPSPNQPYRHQDLKALSRNITNILNSFNVSYDKRVRPNYGGEAVEVGITMFVLSISDLSEVEMDFTLDFYFRQMWKDHRLTFQGPKGVNTLSVSSEFLKSMWVPDTFFVNEKTSYFHTATTNNEFLRISQTGDILRSMRLTVCASCPMDLRHFPMDSQLCTIEIESFGYTMSDLRYKWAAGAGSVGMANDVSLPQFKVFGYRQKTYEISLSSGNYSRLACEIQFVRSMGYYLIQIYIPSSLIVVISWVSFWLNRNAAPARVYLGITTVLTMTTLMSSTNKALPKISYVKSIDVYLGTCFVMVFAALLEYATVGYLAKRIQMRKNHFAALQKMALQLQNARDEHIQKQLPQQQSQPQALPQPTTTPILPPQTPSHHHHLHHHSQHHGSQQQHPTTPHQTPRYNNPDHNYNAQQQQTPSSARFMESTSTNTLRKYNTNNNAQYPTTQHQHHQTAAGALGSQGSIPPGYYSQQQQQRGSSIYEPNRYYDAQQQPVYGANSILQQQQAPGTQYNPQYYNQQNPNYYGGWGSGEGGSTSRGASVKRRGTSASTATTGDGAPPPPSDLGGYGGIPPSLLQQSIMGLGGGAGTQSIYGGSVLSQQQQQQFHHAQQQQHQMMPQTQSQMQVVGSVIGTTTTTTSIEQQQQQQHTGEQRQGGDKIRQLIPINPNQICGITPSDIDKYSRVVFPVCFVCFNLLYWIIYLHISNVNPTADLVLVNPPD